jgi:hypothetical protein
MTTLFIRNLYAKCKMHGSGDAQVVLSDGELYALIVVALNDLGWLDDGLHTKNISLSQDTTTTRFLWIGLSN